MAARFWVGGSGTWDSSTTTNWSTSTGGTSGASAPTTSDTATFDASSGAGTVTLSGTPNCAGIDASATSITTFTGTGTLTCAGNFTLKASMTISGWTGLVTLTGTGAQTMTFAGNTMAFNITVNSNAGTYTAQDAMGFTASAAGKVITLQQGTLNTNGQTVNCGTFDIGSFSSTRVCTLGGSQINCGASSGWTAATTTGLTFNANSSTINCGVSGGSSIPAFTGGGLTYNNVVWAFAANGNTPPVMSGANTFANLTINCIQQASAGYTISANQTVNTLFTISGSTTIARCFLRSDVVGTARTITAASITASNADFMDITGSGAGSWDLHAISGNSGDGGGNSGITFTAPTTQHWTNASSGNWSLSTNWTSRTPLLQDSVVMDKAFGTSQTVTVDMPRIGVSVDWTGATWTTALTWAMASTTRVFGSVTMISGLTMSGTGLFVFTTHTSATFDSKAINFDRPLTIENAGGIALQLSSTLSEGTATSRAFTLTSGSLDLNGQTFTNFGTATCTGSATRAITDSVGTGILELTLATATTVWSASGSNFTTSGGWTLKIDGSTTNIRTFAGGGFTYQNLWFTNATGAGELDFSGSNTFTDIKCTDTNTQTLKFTAGTTTTVTTFTVTGATSNLIVINTVGATTTHALTKAGGGTISCDFLSVQHSVATPANTWYAGANSTNNQGVSTVGSGWIFTVPPAPSTATVFPQIFNIT